MGLAGGCGLGWIEDHSGGGDHLPTRGAGPYSKIPLDLDSPGNEPHVVTIFGANLLDPSALRRRDGGFRLWFGNQPDPRSPASEIWMAELSRLEELPDVGPRQALAADPSSWEQGRIAAPCVVALSGGELVMFYEGGVDSPGIGRADSDDSGATWRKHPGNPLIADLGQPSAVELPDGSWLLYGTRLDSRRSTTVISRARSDDGFTWNVDDAPVLEPRSGMLETYDHEAVSSPWLVIGTTVTGNLHYGLFFNGRDGAGEDGVDAVGWAGSFDGIHWEHFSNPDGPVLEAGPPGELGPTVLLEPDRGVMFFSQRLQGTQSIAAAVHP